MSRWTLLIGLTVAACGADAPLEPGSPNHSQDRVLHGPVAVGHIFRVDNAVCIDILYQRVLQPGEAHAALHARFRPSDIPGDSIPVGEYVLVARAEFGHDGRFPRWHTIPVGTLRIDRRTLPCSS